MIEDWKVFTWIGGLVFMLVNLMTTAFFMPVNTLPYMTTAAIAMIGVWFIATIVYLFIKG